MIEISKRSSGELVKLMETNPKQATITCIKNITAQKPDVSELFWSRGKRNLEAREVMEVLNDLQPENTEVFTEMKSVFSDNHLQQIAKFVPKAAALLGPRSMVADLESRTSIVQFGSIAYLIMLPLIASAVYYLAFDNQGWENLALDITWNNIRAVCELDTRWEQLNPASSIKIWDRIRKIQTRLHNPIHKYYVSRIPTHLIHYMDTDTSLPSISSILNDPDYHSEYTQAMNAIAQKLMQSNNNDTDPMVTFTGFKTNDHSKQMFDDITYLLQRYDNMVTPKVIKMKFSKDISDFLKKYNKELVNCLMIYKNPVVGSLAHLIAIYAIVNAYMRVRKSKNINRTRDEPLNIPTIDEVADELGLEPQGDSWGTEFKVYIPDVYDAGLFGKMKLILRINKRNAPNATTARTRKRIFDTTGVRYGVKVGDGVAAPPFKDEFRNDTPVAEYEAKNRYHYLKKEIFQSDNPDADIVKFMMRANLDAWFRQTPGYSAHGGAGSRNQANRKQFLRDVYNALVQIKAKYRKIPSVREYASLIGYKQIKRRVVYTAEGTQPRARSKTGGNCGKCKAKLKNGTRCGNSITCGMGCKHVCWQHSKAKHTAGTRTCVDPTDPDKYHPSVINQIAL
jgi:hypothetical protein